jgi:hypothetical protein
MRWFSVSADVEKVAVKRHSLWMIELGLGK